MLQHAMMAFALLGADWVLWLLIGLSVGVVAISLERAWYFKRNRSPHKPLAEAVDAFLSSGDLQTFDKSLTEIGGLEARVLHAGAGVGHLGVEAAEKAMSGTRIAERIRLERGLSFIATVGSNAPFVGLFGTVLGIIKAFHDLSGDMSDASAAVMAGISEALVATAIGLLVAIPAVVLYNTLARTAKLDISRTTSLSEMVLARLSGKESAHGS